MMSLGSGHVLKVDPIGLWKNLDVAESGLTSEIVGSNSWKNRVRYGS